MLQSESNVSEQEMKEILANFAVVMDDAVKLAETYVIHACRNSITPEDIKLGLKFRNFYNQQFWSQPNALQKLENYKQLINNEEEEMEEESDDIEMEQPFSVSNCQCPTCKGLNSMFNVWNNWEPPTVHQRIVKNVIDNM
jgi:hypothetical protein